jgi:hypothetical protein
MLLGEAAQPSVKTSKGRSVWAERRTCLIKQSAHRRSRENWTAPANHSRVETIMANPIQPIICRPFTRMRVGVHRHEIELPLLNECVMDLLTVGPCALAPPGHGSLLQAKGVNNGLNRTCTGK